MDKQDSPLAEEERSPRLVRRSPSKFNEHVVPILLLSLAAFAVGLVLFAIGVLTGLIQY